MSALIVPLWKRAIQLSFDAHFDGRTFVPSFDHDRLKGQLANVYTVMQDGRWHTLGEIAYLTMAPESSISARIRDLRKPKFGGHTVERRRRGDPKVGLHEYRLVV